MSALTNVGSSPGKGRLSTARLRIARAIESETEPLYRRKDAGHDDVLPALRAIAFLALELGFTIAEEGGLDCSEVEAAVARVYDLPDYGDQDPRHEVPA
ncbi:hypothetical protein [Saccharomonospora iraqiensis]|uniref:hypothetical protein n=1 Tax=Saccharomonospora iraqiensis TaxID=52698 RepID=UPI00022E896D|nr:hypothetical protein [Saccharomonospora iraqiensis]